MNNKSYEKLLISSKQLRIFASKPQKWQIHDANIWIYLLQMTLLLQCCWSQSGLIFLTALNRYLFNNRLFMMPQTSLPYSALHGLPQKKNKDDAWQYNVANITAKIFWKIIRFLWHYQFAQNSVRDTVKMFCFWWLLLLVHNFIVVSSTELQI
jgi:hypothetical protein